MGRPKLELIVAKKCSHCKLKELEKCEGQMVIKESLLIHCDSFIDKRNNGIIGIDHHIPFPIIKKIIGGKI